MSETRPVEDWYRNPWVWMVICIPFTAVLFGIVMITSATWFPDDVVVDNYYKEGKAINQRLEMDMEASKRNVRATGTFTSDAVELELLGAYDSAVVLKVFHVTDSSLDQEIVLLPESGSRYVADDVSLPFAEAGIWYVEIVGADSNWRLRERVVAPLTTVELNPR